MSIKKYLECGKIINTHGVRGVVKVDPYCDTPRTLAELPKIFRFKNNEYTPITITHGSVQKQFVLLTLEGVDTLEAAVTMKNEIIYADREDFNLNEGDFFIADIIGLPVIDVDDGKKYGTLKDVLNSGSSDIYEIATEDGDVMIPAVAEFIIKVTPEDAIYIRPIPGMFD